MRYYFYLLLAFIVILYSCNDAHSDPTKETKIDSAISVAVQTKQDTIKNENTEASILVDTIKYNKKMLWMANGDSSGKWPVKTPYPLNGAIFPFSRIVAFYGNLYSKGMGILGELPKKEMIAKLKTEIQKWEKADANTPVIPALHYIAVTAQSLPGADGKYRLRMPMHQIDTVINWSREIKGLAFIDVQVGLSNLRAELPRFSEYLKLPDLHLGIDPEFSMKGGDKPGSVIGSYDSDDINYTIDLLADIVRKNNLPPKVLVVHRFTNDMVKNYKAIKKVPEVQVVIDMDGWGGKALKAGTWKRYIYEQPIQFAGFKLFYKNDLKGNAEGMYTPAELMKFKPIPLYIQYQ